MVGNDYCYRRKRQQREQLERIIELAFSGLLVGAMSAIGAVTILGMFGAL